VIKIGLITIMHVALVAFGHQQNGWLVGDQKISVTN
jgi:hypothetical protein